MVTRLKDVTSLTTSVRDILALSQIINVILFLYTRVVWLCMAKTYKNNFLFADITNSISCNYRTVKTRETHPSNKRQKSRIRIKAKFKLHIQKQTRRTIYMNGQGVFKSDFLTVFVLTARTLLYYNLKLFLHAMQLACHEILHIFPRTSIF